MNLILLLTIFVCQGFGEEHSPSNIIVGLISKCDGQNVMGQKISNILRKKMKHKKMLKLYQYKEFDVCEDEMKLSKSIIDLTLSPQWNINGTDKYWIKGVFSYLTDNLLEMAVTLLTFTDIKVYPLIKTNSKPDWFEKQKNFSPMYHSKKVTEPIISQVLGRSKWTNIMIVEFFISKPSLKLNNLIQSFPDRIIRFFAVEGYHNDEKIFRKIERDKNLQVVFVVSKLAAMLLINAQKYDVGHVYWILFSNYKGNRQSPTIPEFTSFWGVVDNYKISEMPFYHNDTKCSDEYIESLKPGLKKTKLEKECGKVNKSISFTEVNHFKSFKKTTRVRIMDSLNEIEVGGDSKINIYQSLGNNRDSTTHHLISNMVETPFIKKTIKLMKDFNINKKIPSCKYVNIKRFENPEKHFSKQIDYFCKRCHSGHFLQDRKCMKCPNGTISMKNQTGCYDPIRKLKVYTIVYVLNGFGIALCLFILCVFIKYRHTPVVRASHFLLSMTQIVCCLALFGLLIVGACFPRTELVCTGRQVLVSLMIIIVDGVVVCKAEQIITICSIKTLIDRKAKRDLLMKQMLIFAFIVMFDLVVIVFCLPNPSLPVRKLFETDVNGNEYYRVFCDFGDKSWLQIVYCIFVLLLSIVQALRGHNRLPDAYNEGNAIITSSATSACCLLFLSIYSSSKPNGLYDGDFISVVSISLSISLIILLFCLYAGKVHIMLFKKSRNTKSFIKTYTKTLEYAAKYFDERRNRHRNGLASVTSITFMQSDSVNCSSVL